MTPLQSRAEEIAQQIGKKCMPVILDLEELLKQSLLYERRLALKEAINAACKCLAVTEEQRTFANAMLNEIRQLAAKEGM